MWKRRIHVVIVHDEKKRGIYAAGSDFAVKDEERTHR